MAASRRGGLSHVADLPSEARVRGKRSRSLSTVPLPLQFVAEAILHLLYG